MKYLSGWVYCKFSDLDCQYESTKTNKNKEKKKTHNQKPQSSNAAFIL